MDYDDLLSHSPQFPPAEHSDAVSISGRSVSFNDEMEMEDSRPPNGGRSEDSEEDSDGVQYIAIMVTSADGSVHDEQSLEAETATSTLKPQSSPARSVQISDSIQRFDEHHDYHPKVESPFHEFGKVFFLVFIWFLMVAFLTSTPEKKILKRQLVIPKDEPKYYNLPTQPHGTLIQITLQAPFLPDPKEHTRRANNRSEDFRNKDNSVIIFLRTASEKILTPNKTFFVYKPEEIDFVNASRIEFIFDIGEDNLEDLHEDDVVQAVIVSNFSKTIDDDKQEMPITFSVDFTPINKPIGVLFAAFTLILLYALIVWEVSHVGCLFADTITSTTVCEHRLMTRFIIRLRSFTGRLRPSSPARSRLPCSRHWTTARRTRKSWDGLMSRRFSCSSR